MEINITTNSNNVITNYATLGEIAGGISIKTDFVDIEEVPVLSIGYYKLLNGKITIDEKLKEEIENN